MHTNMNDHFTKYQIPERKHHSQAFWQIWAPLIVVFLLLAGLFTAILIVTQSGGMPLGQGRDTALILLVLPLVLIGLFTFIALILVIIVTGRIYHFVPQLRLLSMQVDSIASVITTWSNRMMLPFVVLGRLRDRLSSRKKEQLQD
jgi:hypothetical protein